MKQQIKYNGKIYTISKRLPKFIGETQYLLEDDMGKKFWVKESQIKNEIIEEPKEEKVEKKEIKKPVEQKFKAWDRLKINNKPHLIILERPDNKGKLEYLLVDHEDNRRWIAEKDLEDLINKNK